MPVLVRFITSALVAGYCMGASFVLRAQHSIIAIDTLTGEMGVAAVSCFDLAASAIPNDPFFVSVSYPGGGIGVCQAHYNSSNYNDMQSLLQYTNTPADCMTYLTTTSNANDGFNFSHRQYAVVGYDQGHVDAKAYTGSNCNLAGNYFGHRTGRNYSVQVDNAAGVFVVDSIEARYLRKAGNLACRLMYALQGSNFPGADPRCSGVPGLYASLRVCRPGDPPGAYYIMLSVISHSLQGVQVIDSLQKIADYRAICSIVPSMSVHEAGAPLQLALFPNPAGTVLQVSNQSPYATTGVTLRNMMGQAVSRASSEAPGTIDVSLLEPGLYVAEVSLSNGRHYELRFVRQP